MEISDEIWKTLKGGYGEPYDPRSALHQIESGADADTAWSELWEGLHHQGDIGEASFAAVPLIAEIASQGRTSDWNAFALAAKIEECRQWERNPRLPEWLADRYAEAWRKLFDAGLAALGEARDEALICGIMAVLAIHKGQPLLGRMATLSEAERGDMLNEVGWA